MENFLKLIAQRRIWASVIGIIVFTVQFLGIDSGNIDVNSLTDAMVNIGIALGALITAILSAFSYFKPKKNG